MNIPSESAVVGQATFAARFGALLEPKAPAAVFAALDTDGDAALTPRELQKLADYTPRAMDYDAFSRWYHLHLADVDGPPSPAASCRQTLRVASCQLSHV